MAQKQLKFAKYQWPVEIHQNTRDVTNINNQQSIEVKENLINIPQGEKHCPSEVNDEMTGAAKRQWSIKIPANPIINGSTQITETHTWANEDEQSYIDLDNHGEELLKAKQKKTNVIHIEDQTPLEEEQ